MYNLFGVLPHQGPASEILTSSAVAITFFLMPLSTATAAQLIYSQTSGATCQSSGESPNESRCNGPLGYTAVVLKDNGVVRINFGRLSDGHLKRSRITSDLLWRGAASFIHDRIEWRLVRNRPVAAIVLIFTFTEDDFPLQQFLIAKVTPQGSCEIARVSVSESNAYGTGRDIADSQGPITECEFEAR